MGGAISGRSGGGKENRRELSPLKRTREKNKEGKEEERKENEKRVESFFDLLDTILLP